MEDNYEFQIFALALKQPGAIAYFAENLPAEVVGIPSGQTGIHEFYLSLLEYYKRVGTDIVDPIALREWLVESEVSASLGGEVMVAAYIDTMVQIEEMMTPEAITGILKFRANKRKQLDSLQELQLLLTKKDAKSDEDQARIGELTEKIRSIEEEIGYDPLANVMTANDIAQRADDIWDLPDFIPTQFPELNKVLGYTDHGGFCKGAVHAVIAQSGQGKSTLVKCFSNHWMDSGYSVLYVNYEEAETHWERVLMTQLTGKNVYEGATPDEKKKYSQLFRERLAKWGDRFMVRHDPDTPYFDDLEKWLRDIIGHGGRIPDVVIIDTIQSMFMKGSGGKPRWGQFEEMMVRLEKLAKDMHAVFIITSQENSNRMKEGREVVQQSDAGGSLTIIQKSAVTIFITQRKLAASDDSIEDTVMELQIPKNRITGGKYIKQPPLVRYNDDNKSYEEWVMIDTAIYKDEYELDIKGLMH